MGNKAETSLFTLVGDWTVAGVAAQYSHLSQQYSLILAGQSKGKRRKSSVPSPPEIDLAGIAALDACGCQLLAQFAHALQQHGIAPHFTNLPAGLAETIHQLGFSRDISPTIQ